VPAPARAIKALTELLDDLEGLPVTRDQITLLMEGNICDPSVVYEVFPVDPVPFTPTALAHLRERAAA
jgi:NADH dehydrogenase